MRKCSSLTTLSDARKRLIQTRLKSYSPEQIRVVFEKAEASSFLRGEKGGEKGTFKACFDWLMKDANFAKTLDGNYDDKIAVGSSRKADELDGIFQLPVGEQGEAMKHYESKSALCPFYHSEEARAIHCEGTEDNNVLHLIFWSPESKQKYEERFCCAAIAKCRLCGMLYQKYGDEWNVGNMD